jgi:ABC-2 type transport system ATP-binding protein
VSPRVEDSPAVAVSGLFKEFKTRKGTLQVVRGVDFTIGRGEIFALLGPNGAGKTTTIKMIAGLVTPDKGDIKVLGWDVIRQRASVLSQTGAVMEGNRNIYWRLTAHENLLYFSALKQMPRHRASARADHLLSALGLAAKRDELAETLSRGMQQKLAIACALMHEPGLLLLDEPTLGLDLQSADHIQQQVVEVARSGVGVLLTTHQIELAEALSHRVAFLREGQIVREGRTRDLLRAGEHEIYEIEIAAALDEGRRGALASLEVRVTKEEPERCTLEVTHRTGERLYAVLQALAPLPLVSVNKRRPKLVDLFRQVTAKAEEAAS